MFALALFSLARAEFVSGFHERQYNIPSAASDYTFDTCIFHGFDQAAIKSELANPYTLTMTSCLFNEIHAYASAFDIYSTTYVTYYLYLNAITNCGKDDVEFGAFRIQTAKSPNLEGDLFQYFTLWKQEKVLIQLFLNKLFIFILNGNILKKEKNKFMFLLFEKSEILSNQCPMVFQDTNLLCYIMVLDTIKTRLMK